VKRKDGKAQEEVLAGGEAALLELVQHLRALRPEDCTFQSDVVATLLK
jgi:hypothetical protein